MAVGSMDPGEYTAFREVVEAGYAIFETILQLSERNSLRYLPVRVYHGLMRSAAHFIKALSLGMLPPSELRGILDLVERAIRALGSSVPGDMQPVNDYIELLDVNVRRVRSSLLSKDSASLRVTPTTGTASSTTTTATAMRPGARTDSMSREFRPRLYSNSSISVVSPPRMPLPPSVPGQPTKAVRKGKNAGGISVLAEHALEGLADSELDQSLSFDSSMVGLTRLDSSFISS